MPWKNASPEALSEYAGYKNKIRFVREYLLEITTLDQFEKEIVAFTPEHRISAKTLGEVEKAGLPKKDRDGNENGIYKEVAARTQAKLFHALNALLEKKGMEKIINKQSLFEEF